jgi:inorganic phosphate transporter, PiT family
VHNAPLLFIVVATALAFDFTNGFHDTANSMATTIATGSLKPKVAVGLSAVLNLAGAFLSLSVASVIAKGIVSQGSVTLPVVFAGLAGGILWNVVTWYNGLPSSSSHALIGGVVGAMLVHAGAHAVEWKGVVGKVMLPALLAPLVAGLIAAMAAWLTARFTSHLTGSARNQGFRWAQVGAASLMSLAHGTNDAQKTMGVITLALVANGSIVKSATTPTWVIIACGGAIALGTYVGGWRIIRTMGKGMTDVDTPQGFAAQTSAATVLLASTHFGIPLSTTQVASGAVVGSGVGHRVRVRWSIVAEIIVSWLVTMPAAGLVGAAAFALSNVIGQTAGVYVTAALLAVACAAFYLRSRQVPVTPENVNDAWDEDVHVLTPQHLAA